MEADWEFEIGGDAPVIESAWPGFVNLRWTPQSATDLAGRVRSLPEAVQLPSLALTLERLNSQQSPVWTSKCDFWPVLQPEDFDPDELDSPPTDLVHAMGCYIDLLPKNDHQWPTPDMVEAACKHWCTRSRSVALRSCRADFIIRRASITHGLIGLGITAYITACGSNAGVAKDVLGNALTVFADALCPH